MGLATTPETDDRGFYALSELLGHEFTSRLVVLSGCETGLGRSRRGEGLTGLTWGLLASGADSVISTVWPIPDRPSAAFVQHFYEALAANGARSDQAFLTAQRKMAGDDRYRHPQNWAGYILTVGSQSALQLDL